MSAEQRAKQDAARAARGRNPSPAQMQAEDVAAEAQDRPLDLPDRAPDVPNVYEFPEYADADVYIVRDDLPGDARTFVAAGHAIPRGLEGFPRESA